jgi:EmrB/QacA subfamily drug resistance transporter
MRGPDELSAGARRPLTGSASVAPGRGFVAATTVASFLSPFSIAAVTVALPALGREFHLGPVALGWVTTAYLLGAAVVLIPIGRLSDIYGRRRLFLLAIGVFTASSILCAVAPSPELLIVFRILQGVGGGTLFSGILAMLASAFSPDRRGVPIGLSAGAVYVGSALGPVVGGLLTQTLGWRSLFVVTAAAGVGVSGLALVSIRGEWAEARGERFDPAGAVLLGVFLVAALYGFSSLPSAVGVGLVLAAAPLFALFLWWEGRTRSPMINPASFRQNRVFAFANLTALCFYAATFGVAFLLSVYLQEVKGLTAAAAGAVLLVQPLVQSVAAPVAGWLSNRIGPRVLLVGGVGVTVPALAAFAFLHAGTSLAAIAVALALLGSGYAFVAPSNATMIMGAVDRRGYGVASTTFSAMRLVGQSLGMALIMGILAVTLGGPSPDSMAGEGFVRGARWAFTLSVLLAAGALVAGLHTRPSRPAGGSAASARFGTTDRVQSAERMR